MDLDGDHVTDDAHSLSAQAAGVISLIDELGISNAVLCGYDVGSFTVQTIATKRPDLAHSPVIARASAVGSWRRRPSTPSSTRSLTESHAAPGAFVASVMWFRRPEGNPITYYANETKPAPDDRFPKHVTILWPDSDPLFPTEWSETLDDYYSDNDLYVVANTGHFSPVDSPETWTEHIHDHAQAASK